MAATEIDHEKLEAFMGQAVTDMGAVISAPLFVIGERLGPLQGDGGRGPDDLRAGGGARRGRRALGA
jgi:hypothetical protein